MLLEMRFDLGTLDSGERSLPFGLLVSLTCFTDRSNLFPYAFLWERDWTIKVFGTN